MWLLCWRIGCNTKQTYSLCLSHSPTLLKLKLSLHKIVSKKSIKHNFALRAVKCNENVFLVSTIRVYFVNILNMSQTLSISLSLSQSNSSDYLLNSLCYVRLFTLFLQLVKTKTKIVVIVEFQLWQQPNNRQDTSHHRHHRNS